MTAPKRVPLPTVRPNTVRHHRSRYLEEPLKPLRVQVEVDGIAYEPHRPFDLQADHRIINIRPLFATVREQAAGWLASLRAINPKGRIQIYAELCRRVCLVASTEPDDLKVESMGFGPSDETDGLNFDDPVHLAWGCLLLGSSRVRNQRPRHTGPVTPSFLFRPEEFRDWGLLQAGLKHAEEQGLTGEKLGLPPSEDPDEEYDRRWGWLTNHVFPKGSSIRAAVDRAAERFQSHNEADQADVAEVANGLNSLLSDPSDRNAASAWALDFLEQSRCGTFPPFKRLPRREQERQLRLAVEALLVSRESDLGQMPDGIVASAAVQAFTGKASQGKRPYALPIYNPRSGRLLGMVYFDEAPRPTQAETMRQLLGGMIVTGLNNQLAHLEASFRLAEAKTFEGVIEVALHIARKYVGANDCCLRELDPVTGKVFSCKADCQHTQKEFGSSAKVNGNSLKVRLMQTEAKEGIGTVYDNMMAEDRDGEMIGHLLRDDRHVQAAKNINISIFRFNDNSAMLVRVAIGLHVGIVVLHHIATNYYTTADFVLTRSIMRIAELRLAELKHGQMLRAKREQSERIGDTDADRNLIVLKLDLFERSKHRVTDRWRTLFQDQYDFLALYDNLFQQVLEVCIGEESSDGLRSEPGILDAVREESCAFEFPRYLWIPANKERIFVDTSYDFAFVCKDWVQTDYPAVTPSPKSRVVVLVPIPGHDIGRLWIEKSYEGSEVPLTPDDMKKVDQFAQWVAADLEASWGEYVATESWRSEQSRISAHNLGHEFDHLKMQLAELQKASKGSPEALPQLLQQLDGQVETIQKLTRGAMSLAAEMSPDRIPVSDLMHDLEENLSGYARREKIDTQWLCEGPPAIVRVDTDKIGEVLRELFNNAAYVMRDCEVRVFKVRAVTHPGTVHIFVSDTGCGIEPHLREEIFEPGYSTKGGGRGLGLRAIRRYVQLNRGRLRAIEPPDGRGACFEITLPNMSKDGARQ